jgi:hypothetical protein
MLKEILYIGNVRLLNYYFFRKSFDDNFVPLN